MREQCTTERNRLRTLQLQLQAAKTNASPAGRRSGVSSLNASFVSNDGGAAGDADADVAENDSALDVATPAEEIAAAAAAALDPLLLAEQRLPTDQAEQELRVRLRFLADALVFAQQMAQVVETALPLLFSKTSSDVVESIRLFVVASQFRVDNAAAAVRRMLSLAWSKDQNIKDALLVAFTEL